MSPRVDLPRGTVGLGMKSQVHALYLVWLVSITPLEAFDTGVAAGYRDSIVAGDHITGKQAARCSHRV